MLKKLFKYEFSNNYKFLLIFYGLAFIFALFTRFFSIFDNSNFLIIISKICFGATISMCFNILINNLMRLWVDFKNSFYGDRAYLIQTLPIKRETIFLSKVLFSVFTLFVSMFVIAISLLIAIYSKENFEIFKVFLEKTVESFNTSIFGFILIIILLLFTQFLFILLSGYLGMVIGFRRHDKKMGFSVIYSLLIYLTGLILAFIIIFVISLFNKTIYSNLFSSPEFIEFWILKLLMILMTFIYVCCNIAIYIISHKLLKKGIDVD